MYVVKRKLETSSSGTRLPIFLYLSFPLFLVCSAMDFISVLKSCHLPAADGKLWHARLFRCRSFLFAKVSKHLLVFFSNVAASSFTELNVDYRFCLYAGNDVFLPETSEGFTVSVLLVTGQEKTSYLPAMNLGL